MKGCSKRTVMENKCDIVIDSTCLTLIKFEFEILCNNYLWQQQVKTNELYMISVCAFYCFQLPICLYHILIPDKILCVRDLFWVGQFDSTFWLYYDFAFFLRFSYKWSGWHMRSTKNNCHLEWSRTLLI